MRKVILAIVLLLAIAFIILSFSELQSIAETLRRSDWRFLLLALIAEVVWLINLAVTFRSIFRVVDLEEGIQHLMLVVTAANFVNVVAPSAGIGGMAVLLDDAKQRNHPTGRVTVIGALFVLLDYFAFLCVLAFGLVVFIRRNNLNIGEITATLILLGIASTMSLLLYLGYRSGKEMGRALAWMGRVINRVLRPFIHRDYLQEERAYVFANEFSEGLSVIKGRTRKLIWPFLLTLNNKAILLCVLTLVFLAFQTPFSIGTLVGGYSIANLFAIVSPTPAGLGIVEGVMTIALNSLRVQWEAAVLITLTYRAVTFWFPLAVGVVAFRLLHRSK